MFIETKGKPDDSEPQLGTVNITRLDLIADGVALVNFTFVRLDHVTTNMATALTQQGAVYSARALVGPRGVAVLDGDKAALPPTGWQLNLMLVVENHATAYG